MGSLSYERPSPVSLRQAFSDPRPFIGQDPHITRYEDHYLLIESQDESRITISRLDSLQSTQRRNITIVHDFSSERQVWAPELHLIANVWHIFYTFSDGQNHSHRNHVLISTTESPFGPYTRHRIGADIWGIDLTTFNHAGFNYAVWSGWESNHTEGPQNLYISRLWGEERLLISAPSLDWEISHSPINEGPQFDSNSGFLYFSANASWTQDYCTGALKLIGDDPLLPESWYKHPTPLLMNAGHGHVIDDSFVYASKLSPFPGWNDREIRITPLTTLF